MFSAAGILRCGDSRYPHHHQPFSGDDSLQDGRIYHRRDGDPRGPSRQRPDRSISPRILNRGRCSDGGARGEWVLLLQDERGRKQRVDSRYLHDIRVGLQRSFGNVIVRLQQQRCPHVHEGLSGSVFGERRGTLILHGKGLGLGSAGLLTIRCGLVERWRGRRGVPDQFVQSVFSGERNEHLHGLVHTIVNK